MFSKFWKTSQNSQTNLRSSHPEVLCQKMFLEILPDSQKNIFAGISFSIKLQAGKLKLSEAATVYVQWNKVFLKVSQISKESLSK